MTLTQKHYGNANDDYVNFTDDSIGLTTRWDQRGRRRAAGPVPTAVVGAAAGTGATLTSITGSDESGTLTINGGTAPAAGVLATVTFSGAYSVAPYVTVFPKTAAAAPLQLYASATTTALVISCAVAPAASASIVLDYQAIGGA